MSKTNNKTKKNPLRSKTGEICVTGCKEKNELFVHPVTLHDIRRDYNVCAIFPTQTLPQSDPTDLSYRVNIDACNIGDNDKFDTPDEIQMFLLTFNFDPRVFLKNIYNIQSFEDTIKWTLENNKFPFETIKRVHSCAWKVYGKNLENITTIIYKYYYEIASKRWLKSFIQQIEQKYSFDIINRDVTSDNATVMNATVTNATVSDAILSDILTYDNFVTIIKKCNTENQEIWADIVSHYDFIKDYVYQYIIKALNKTDILKTA